MTAPALMLTELPPGPEDALLAVLAQTFALPVGVVAVLAFLLWAKSWIDFGKDTLERAGAAADAVRSVPGSFARLVVVQTLFVALTAALTKICIALMTLSAADFTAVGEPKVAQVLGRAVTAPLEPPASYAVLAALAFVALADLSAATWGGMSSLGCMLGSGPALIVMGIGATAAIYAHDLAPQLSVATLVLALVLLAVLVAVWGRLVSLTADAPRDFRHAVAVERSGRQPSTGTLAL